MELEKAQGRRPAPLRPEELRFALVAGGATLGFLLLVFVLYPVPVPVLVLGVVLGSLNALTAMGLVLVYRANRIVNFAQADMGALAAVLAASLIVGPMWGFFPAMVAGLAAALAIGALTEVTVVRRLSRAPRLLLSVATVGVAQLLAGLSLALPRLFDYDTAPQPPRPFGSFRLEWFPVVFTGGSLLIVLTVPAVAAGLALFFRRTRFGVAVRAAAESADRAALLGIPVARLNTLVWVMAAGMSGLAVLLRMPIQGVSIGATFGLTLLLRALAAAVIGRMENLPVTFVAAVAIGVIEQAVFFDSGRTVVVDAVLVVVILAGLLLQRRGGLERAREVGASTWQAVREVRPIPAELRHLPEVRWSLAIGKVAAVVAVLVVALRAGQGDVFTYSVALIYAMLMLSLVVLTGWAGQISLGQLAIAGIAGAATATLHFQDRDVFFSLAVATLVGAGVALALGVPALRIQGPFLAVTTLAFAVATGTFFLNREYFPWLMPDPSRELVRPVIFGKFDLDSEHTFFVFTLAILGLVIAAVLRLQRSRTGRVLVANRDNTRAAQSYGISPVRAQLTAFGISGGVAGLAGGLYVLGLRGVPESLLVPYNNLELFAIGVIGGLGSVPGALLGAGYLAFVDLSPFTRSPMSQFLASGVGVLVILMLFPGGLGGLLYDTRDRLLRTLARVRGIVVPSLLADVRVGGTVGDAVVGDDVGLAHRASTTPSGDPLLVLRDLEVAYGRTQVLFGVTMHVERGEVVALLGTNGAGKSTLLSTVCGLLAPKAGTVIFDGVDVTGISPVDAVRTGIVLMPGGKGVFPTLTVEENLRLAGWLHQRDPEHVQTATARALEHFPVLRERWGQRAGNLSGGEQQMLTLAMALIARPRLLLIDELSLGLAPIVVERLLAIVGEIHRAGTTVVLVEQSVNVAITLAARAVFLEKGEVRFDGPTAELLEHPEILRAVFLDGAARRAGDGPVMGMAATGARERRPFSPRCDTCGHEHPLALELLGASVSFGGVQAVNGVDLAVHQSQIVGMIGPNGAGKTTVLDLISGFVTPTAGKVLLAGQDVTALAPAERALRGLGRSFQDARLFPAMTVRQTIATALERHVEVRDPMAALLLSPAVRISERAVAEEVDALVELMRLEAYADKFVGELSTGTRRVVDLACTLAHRPSVLLLDEPSSGIAQREAEALAPVLADIRDRTGAAMVVVEHDMPLICEISDELVALELGAVIARGAPAEVVADPRVVAGYLGEDAAVIHRSGVMDPTNGGSPPASGRTARRRRPLRAGR